MSAKRQPSLIVVCIAVMLTSIAFVSLAQDDTISAVPSLPDFAMDDYPAYLQAQLAGFEVAYIVSEEDEAHLQGNLLGADVLAETFGVTRFAELAEVEGSETPFNALIVTAEAVAAAPQEALTWLADEYRRGTIIAFVNVPFEAHLTALNITCKSQRYIQLVDYPVDWVAVYQFAIVGEDVDKVAAVIEAYDRCVPAGKIDTRGLDSIEIGSGNSDLVSDERGGLLVLEMLGTMLETSSAHTAELN